MASTVWSVLGIFRLAICYILSLGQFLVPLAQSAALSEKYDDWNENQPFSIQNDTIVLEKTDPYRDFVVLNLTDIQLDELEVNREDCRKVVERTIRRLVQEVSPDLITVTGDNAWGMTAYLHFAQTLDSLGVPWAPVMGNHDGQRTFSEEWCCQVMMNCKNCLFRLGPNGMGHGNYIITITENGQPIHALYMMDSHGDGIHADQVKWYEWAVKGMTGAAGKTVESTVVMHIPVEEYQLAWNEAVGADATDSAYGVRHERICWEEDNGLFEKMVSLDSTKTMLCGHDHINNFQMTYRGISLNYSLHTGIGCYWEESLSGGTTMRIGSDGHNTVAHKYIDPRSLGVWFDEKINPNH